jgi:hypothetical protein
MSHKFHIGQLVEFRPKKGSPISAARGAYEILKQMPKRDGELQYRIKNAAEQHERIALESEQGRFSCATSRLDSEIVMLLHIEIGLQAIVAAPRPSTRQFAIARPHPTIVLADATGPGDQQDADASEPGRSGNIQRQIDLQPFSDILPCIRNVKPALAIAPQAQQTFGALPDRRSAGLFRHTRQRVGDTPQSA